MGASGSDDDAIPFYLMPVAALFGMMSLFLMVRILYLVYANLTYRDEEANKKKATTSSSGGGGGDDDVRPRRKVPPTVRLGSVGFLVLCGMVLCTVLAYAKVVAIIDTAMVKHQYALFDPYEILEISESANSTEIKQAYRRLSKLHHPDKQRQQQQQQQSQSSETFLRINLAYRALSDPEGRRNYQEYGHPDGPHVAKQLSFALPDWLLKPQGNIALVLLVLYLASFALLIAAVISWSRRASMSAETKAQAMSVAGTDLKYLASHLTPTSTHMDVLFLIATTPESIQQSQNQLNKIDAIKEERRKLQQKARSHMGSSSSSSSSNKEGGDSAGGAGGDAAGKAAGSGGTSAGASGDAFDIDGGGWDDDGDGTEKTEEEKAAEKREEDERRAKQERMVKATGKSDPTKALLEGIDDGVLGQVWVEKVLTEKGVWPPQDLGIIRDKKFPLRSINSRNRRGIAAAGKKSSNADTMVSPMDHPAIRRNLCRTLGRLHALHLNTHPDLLEAHGKKLLDKFYFESALEYRQRVGILSEGILRIAVSMQSYRLTKTVIETVAMFKIGVSDPLSSKAVDWFRDVMKRQHGNSPSGIPALELSNVRLETPGEDELATGDTVALTMDMERLHCQTMLHAKMELCKKQGIPPQVAIQSYREGWWILVRARMTMPATDDKGENQNEDGDDKKKDDGGEEINDEHKETTTSSSPKPPPIRTNPVLQIMDESTRGKFEDEPAEYRLWSAVPMIVQNLQQATGKVKVQFRLPEDAPGTYRITVDVKSQEFLGADQEIDLTVSIVDSSKLETRNADDDDDGDDTKKGDDDEDEPKKDK